MYRKVVKVQKVWRLKDSWKMRTRMDVWWPERRCCSKPKKRCKKQGQAVPKKHGAKICEKNKTGNFRSRKDGRKFRRCQLVFCTNKRWSQAPSFCQGLAELEVLVPPKELEVRFVLGVVFLGQVVLLWGRCFVVFRYVSFLNGICFKILMFHGFQWVFDSCLMGF